MKSAALIANGEFSLTAEIAAHLGKVDLIVCADGGATNLLGTEFSPDLIIGDLDSVSEEALKSFETAEVIRNEDDNSTDLVKAMDWLISEKAAEVTIFGVTGKRTDQTLASVSLLEKYAGLTNARLVDESAEIRYVGSEYEFRSEPGRKTSLISANRPAIISTSGLHWDLTDYELRFSSEAISNHVQTGVVKFSVSAGIYLFILNE
ncbi:MAG: thiamine diphosphokinase, partial [Thermoplasmata archaeon]|nr:thiamine diphosphokinase [Thermoplasmata archaeon]